MKSFIRRHPLLSVFAFVTVCVLPMMLFRDPSPSNELRYLGIVDEALKGGHFFCFFDNGIPYTDKPPLFFWILMFLRLFCSATCMWLPCILTALLPTFITVAVMDKWLRLNAGNGEITTLQRLLAVAVMLGGMLIMLQTFYLRMDMLMTMFIVLALYTFYKLYICQSKRTDKWLLGLYIFLALFSKGPVGILVPVVTIVVFLALERKLGRIWEFLGWRQWLLMLLLFGGWILGAYLEGGREYINSLLFHQTLDRAVNAFAHKQPFWYYLGAILYCVLPYTLLVIPALIYLYIKPAKGNTYERVLLTAISVTFVMLSAFSGKLAIYLTPILPLIAYLMPVFDITTSARANGLKKAAVIVSAAIIMILGAALWTLYLAHGSEPFSLMAFALALELPYLFCTTLLAIAAVFALAGLGSIIVTCVGGWQKGAIALFVTMFLAVFAAGLTIEPLNEWTAYEKVAEAALQASDGGNINTLYMNRPENMDIYLDSEVTDFGNDVDAFLTGDRRGGVLIVPTAKARESTSLKEYLESSEGTTVGPYTVYGL